MTHPELLAMFAGPRDRVRMDSVTLPPPGPPPPPPPTDIQPRTTPDIRANRNIFITSP